MDYLRNDHYAVGKASADAQHSSQALLHNNRTLNQELAYDMNILFAFDTYRECEICKK